MYSPVLVVFLFFAPNSIVSQDESGAELFRGFMKSLRQVGGLYAPRMGSAHFGYSAEDGPDKWGESYPECYGRFQSPIDIDTNTLEYREIKRPLKWGNLNKVPAYMDVAKSENSLGMTTAWRSKWDIPYISGGPLTERYYFYHLHFHWNTSSNAGSEHTVNGRKYPMEVHVVYTTNQGGPPTEKDKKLVTGFMVTISANDNPGFGRIIDGISDLRGEAEKDVSIPPFPLSALNLDFCEDYVIYSGSLTTPPCTGGVTWIVSSRPVPLSFRQYNTLKQIVSVPGQKVSANARPVQYINGRKVFYIVSPGCPRRS